MKDKSDLKSFHGFPTYHVFKNNLDFLVVDNTLQMWYIIYP